jgi:hypothetical protein
MAKDVPSFITVVRTPKFADTSSSYINFTYQQLGNKPHLFMVKLRGLTLTQNQGDNERRIV